MKYRILVLASAFFLWNGCKKFEFPDWDFDFDYDTEIKGEVVSRADQQPIANIRLSHRACDFSGFCYTFYLGNTDATGHFRYIVDLSIIYDSHYLVMEGIDSLYNQGGYVNGVYTPDLTRIAIDTTAFKIELTKK